VFEHLVARLHAKEALEVSSRATTAKIRVAGKTNLAMIRRWRGIKGETSFGGLGF